MTRDMLKGALPTKLLHRGTITDFKTIFFSREFPKTVTELYFCRKISAFRKKPARYLLKASNRLPSFSREPLARRLRAKLNDCDAIVVRHKITRQSHHQRHRTRAQTSFEPFELRSFLHLSFSSFEVFTFELFEL